MRKLEAYFPLGLVILGAINIGIKLAMVHYGETVQPHNWVMVISLTVFFCYVAVEKIKKLAKEEK